MENLHYLAATDAVAAFRRRLLSPVELMQAVIAQAERVEPVVNAFSHTYFAEALAQARVAERRYRTGEERPLEGIPVAIKSSFEIAGQPSSIGSLVAPDYVAAKTSPTVQRLLDAGAIVHARTTTPEFTCVGFTWSPRWGVTRNPWNVAFTPGGSSGGAGAALAAGTTTLANGGDIAGSIRIPAALCGLVGFKPPYGRNPDGYPYNLEYYYSAGPLARSVADCILLQNVMAGPHPIDIASLKPKQSLPTSYEGIAGWRIAYSLDLGYQSLAAEVRENTLAALARFRELGAVVEEVEIGWGWELLAGAKAHLGYAATAVSLVQSLAAANAQELTPYARQSAEQAKRVTQPEAYAAERLAGAMYEQFGQLFAQYDLFVCPTIANGGVTADFDCTQDVVVIDGEFVDPFFGWFMTYPFNMLSRCPVLTVPSGRAANGVPTGIQLVGPTYEDARVFQAAAAYEAMFTLPPCPPVVGGSCG